jgi:hypothetical protein
MAVIRYLRVRLLRVVSREDGLTGVMQVDKIRENGEMERPELYTLITHVTSAGAWSLAAEPPSYGGPGPPRRRSGPLQGHPKRCAFSVPLFAAARLRLPERETSLVFYRETQTWDPVDDWLFLRMERYDRGGTLLMRCERISVRRDP